MVFVSASSMSIPSAANTGWAIDEFHVEASDYIRGYVPIQVNYAIKGRTSIHRVAYTVTVKGRLTTFRYL